MVLRTTRWWLRAVAKPLRNHVVVRWTLWLLALVQLDAMADLASASRMLVEQPPWVAGAALGGLVGLQALSERTAIRDLVLGPRHSVVRRQPIPGWALGPAVGLALAVFAAPIGAVGALWYRAPGPALAWTALAAGPMLLLAARQRTLAVLATAAAALVAAGLQALPGLALPVGVAAWAAVAPAAGLASIHWATGPADVPRSAPWRPRTMLGGVVMRDLTVLWRTERPIVWSALALAPLLGAVVAAVRINGLGDERALTLAAAIGLAVAGPLALSALGAVASHVGARLDPPSWPISSGRRAVALTLVGGLTMVPSWAAAAVSGAPVLGAAGHLRIALLVAAIAAGAAWAIAVRPRRPDHGLFPWWIGLVLAGTLLPLRIGGPMATGLLALALWRATTRLEVRRTSR